MHRLVKAKEQGFADCRRPAQHRQRERRAKCAAGKNRKRETAAETQKKGAATSKATPFFYCFENSYTAKILRFSAVRSSPRKLKGLPRYCQSGGSVLLARIPEKQPQTICFRQFTAEPFLRRGSWCAAIRWGRPRPKP